MFSFYVHNLVSLDIVKKKCRHVFIYIYVYTYTIPTKNYQTLTIKKQIKNNKNGEKI